MLLYSAHIFSQGYRNHREGQVWLYPMPERQHFHQEKNVLINTLLRGIWNPRGSDYGDCCLGDSVLEYYGGKSLLPNIHNGITSQRTLILVLYLWSVPAANEWILDQTLVVRYLWQQLTLLRAPPLVSPLRLYTTIARLCQLSHQTKHHHIIFQVLM
jgi:hypothetical protein